MIKIVVTAHARNDLVRLRQFLAKENPDAARKAVGVLVSAIDRLADFPEMGRCVEALPDLRVLNPSFGNSGYRIYYRWLPLSKQILILKIKHQKEA